MLTTNPAFDTPQISEWARVTEAVVCLSEMGQDAGAAWDKVLQLRRWAVVVESRDLRAEQRTWLTANGRLWEDFGLKDKVVYKKGWWKSGERNLIQPTCKLQVWVSCNVEIPTVRVDGQVCGTVTSWKPPPLPHNCTLDQYLCAQPSVRFTGVDHILVATDGSLRKVGEARAMGAAAVWAENGRVEVVRVGGVRSSTRPELMAILLAIQSTQKDKDLWILVDSANALSRLGWFKRSTFRPPGYRIKDLDVVLAILHEVQMRSGQVKIVKVNGHTGDPIHGKADVEAVRVAADEVAEIYFDALLPSIPHVEFEDGSCKPWPSSVVRSWNSAAARLYWNSTSTTDHSLARAFLGQQHVGRHQLGQVVREMCDWAVRDWIRMVTPMLLPTLATRFKWKLVSCPNCTLPQCTGGAQTMVHLQLQCLNESVKNTRQKAHDRVVGTLQRAIETVKRPTVRTAWAPTTVASFWPSIDWGEGLARLQPDGFFEDTDSKTIYILEVARTTDDVGTFDGARAGEKLFKYERLRKEVGRVMLGYNVEVREFVIGIRGSIPVARWALHLDAMGVAVGTQKRTITDAIREKVEGSARVITAWKRQSSFGH